MTILGAIVGFKIAGWKGALVGAGGAAALAGLFNLEEYLNERGTPDVTSSTPELTGSAAQYQMMLIQAGMLPDEAYKFMVESGYITSTGELIDKIPLSSLPAHASGGIFYTRHIAEVAERGAEAIIPLERTKKNVELLQVVGEHLGVMRSAPIESVTQATINNTYNTMKVESGYITSTGELIDEIPSQSLPAHARGGIFYTRHIAEVAERGAEAIIPLERTEQAVRLWRAVGEYIGAIPKEVTYSVQAQAVTPLGSVPYGAVTKSNVINLNVNTEGLISEVVINNKADVDEAVDKIVGVLAPELRKAFSNMVVG